MEPERWKRIEALFFELLDGEAGARAGRLAAARAKDPEAAGEAEAMLAAHEPEASAAIERFLLAETRARVSDERGARSLLGSRVGPFRLVERLGQGGMGEVFLGERVDGQFEQRVAVKLLRAGFAASDTVARFRAEREILARLQHSSIARLLDGGLTEDGLPFLAMEYVKGEGITQFCDARKLPVEARLRLVLDVCRAVHFAHQSLVVHRDLKPSNLLITERGEVKLLDFGIAKLLEGGSAEAITRTGLLLLTPEYASPEQVRGDAVTTATDVYALGLLLFEILTGERAQPVGDSSPLGVARAVCETEARRPSLAVLDEPAAEAVDRASAGERALLRGGVSPEQLSRRLRGDLDTVVATALHKDPARRYASAEALADDLERHLTGFPIQARADSFGYRTGKFLRRHRWAAIASAAAILALVAGLLVAVLGLLRARAAEAAARRDAETSRQVSELLVGIFEVNDPGENRGASVTARELLDRGAEKVRADLKGQPEVQANLLRTMGRAYSKLGLFDRAQSLFESDRALRERLHGAEAREVAISLTLIGSEAARRGDFKRARELGRRALAIHERSGRTVDLDLAQALIQLGVARMELGETDGARGDFERALAIQERLLGTGHPELGTVLNDLAIVCWQTHDLAGAQPLYERALALYRRRYGERHPTVANTLNNLALIHFDAGRLDQALALHEQALAIRRSVLAPDHPDIAESLNNLANVRLERGETEAARSLLEEALAIRERVLGPEHPFVAASLCNLGMARARLGDPRAAIPLLERSVAIFSRALGPTPLELATPLQFLAQVYRRNHNLPGADRTSKRALAICEGAPRTAAPAQLKVVLGVRALVLRDLGRPAEAAALEKRAAAL